MRKGKRSREQKYDIYIRELKVTTTIALLISTLRYVILHAWTSKKQIRKCTWSKTSGTIRSSSSTDSHPSRKRQPASFANTTTHTRTALPSPVTPAPAATTSCRTATTSATGVTSNLGQRKSLRLLDLYPLFRENAIKHSNRHTGGWTARADDCFFPHHKAKAAHGGPVDIPTKRLHHQQLVHPCNLKPFCGNNPVIRQ